MWLPGSGTNRVSDRTLHQHVLEGGTHVWRNPGAVFHRVPLNSEVINLAVTVSEHKMFPGGDVLTEFGFTFCFLQQALG